jgi:hypothetical protein
MLFISETLENINLLGNYFPDLPNGLCPPTTSKPFGFEDLFPVTYAGVNQYVTLFYSIWGGQRRSDHAIFVLSSAIVTNTGESIYNTFTFMWKVKYFKNKL